MPIQVYEVDIYGKISGDIIPPGYKKTNFRMVILGDTYLSPKGDVNTHVEGDTFPAGPRIILKKVETPKMSVQDIYYGAWPVTPSGYILTGEFRAPISGDSFISQNRNNPGDVTTYGASDTWCDKPRLILKKLPTYPTAPEGYKLGEFKELGIADKDIWLGLDLGVYKVPISSVPHVKHWRFTLIPDQPKPAPPTILSTYGTSIPVIPEGYEAVEFRQVKNGDTYLSLYNGSVITPGKGYGDTWVPAVGFYRLILLPIPTLTEIYGTDKPAIPVGWESTGRVGKVKDGEFFLMAIDGKAGKEGNTGCMDTVHRGYRLLLRKSPSKPNEQGGFYPGMVIPTTNPTMFAPSKRWLIEVEENDRMDYTHSRIIGTGLLRGEGLTVLSVKPI